MSGLEILGSISAVIGIIDVVGKIWDSAHKDLKLSEAFEVVANRLPLLRDTLEVCYQQLKPLAAAIPEDVAQSLKNITIVCKERGDMLAVIFRETIEGSSDEWFERYKKVARRFGKGKKVEELMRLMTEDVQTLVSYHTVKSARPELHARLAEVVEQLKAVEPSLSPEETALQSFASSGGPQYVSTGSSKMYNSTGSSSMHHYDMGGFTGSPTINFVAVNAARERQEFSGIYSSVKLESNSKYVLRERFQKQLHECLLGAHQDSRTRTAVLWGLPGVGKTQLARKYVHEYGSQYQAVFWVAMDRRERIEASLLGVHRLLYHDRRSTRAITVETAIAEIKGLLQNQKNRCLWVLDGANEVDGEQSQHLADLEYLLDSPCLDRIITSRTPIFEIVTGQKGIHVTELSQEEAVAVFRRYADWTDDLQHLHEVQDAVQELGYFALAVARAGSYAGEMGSSLEPGDLLENIREWKDGKILQTAASFSVHQYNQSLSSTWEASLMAISRECPLATRLLTLLSFMNHDDIFIDFTKLLSFQDQEMLDTGWVMLDSTENDDIYGDYEHHDQKMAGDGHDGLADFKAGLLTASCDPYLRRSLRDQLLASISVEQIFRRGRRESSICNWVHLLSPMREVIRPHDIRAAISGLRRYAFLTKSTDNDSYDMNSLVQAWCRGRCDDVEKRLWSLAAAGCVIEAIHGFSSKEDVLVQGRRLIPHIMANINVLSLAHDGEYQIDLVSLRQLNAMSFMLSHLGEYAEAYQLDIFLRRKLKLILQSNDLELLGKTGDVADFELRSSSTWQQAESTYRELFHKHTTMLGPKHPLTLRYMVKLSQALLTQKKFVDAEELIPKMVEIQEQVLGQGHNLTSHGTALLAELFKEQGNYEESERLYRCLLLQAEGVEGTNRDSQRLISPTGGLAHALMAQSRFREAESLFRRQLQLNRQFRGNKHFATFTSMLYTATAIICQGDAERAIDAEGLLDEAKDIIGDRSITDSWCLELMQMLCLAYRLQNKLKEVANCGQFLHFALQTLLHEGRLRSEHRNLLGVVEICAFYMHLLCRGRDLKEISETLLQARRRLQGRQHGDTIRALAKLIVVLRSEYANVEADRLQAQLRDLDGGISWLPLIETNYRSICFQSLDLQTEQDSSDACPSIAFFRKTE